MTGYQVLYATKPLISLGMTTKPTASGHQKDNNSGQPLPPVPYPPDPGWKWVWFPERKAGWRARCIPSRISRKTLTPRRMHNVLHVSAFRRVLDLLFPWVLASDYPGQYYCTIKAAGAENVARSTVWRWRSGKTRAPIEVCEALADYAESRARLLLEAVAELRALPRGKDRRGPHGTGGRVPYRLRAEKEQREALARERALYLIERPNEVPAVEATGCRAFVEAALGRKLD